MKHKKKPSNVGPWVQYRDLNIYANPLGEIKYKCGSKEYLFKKWDFYSRNNVISQKVIMTKNRRYYVKRIVWECFKGAIPEGYAIVHKIGNKDDSLSNLRIEKVSTYSKKVSGNYKKRFIIDKTHNRTYKGALEASKYLNLCKSSVIRYCNKQIENPLYELEWGGLVSGEDL